MTVPGRADTMLYSNLEQLSRHISRLVREKQTLELRNEYCDGKHGFSVFLVHPPQNQRT